MKFLQTLLLESVIQSHVESSMTRMSGLIILNVTLVLYTSTSHGICLHIYFYWEVLNLWSQICGLVLLKLTQLFQL